MSAFKLPADTIVTVTIYHEDVTTDRLMAIETTLDNLRDTVDEIPTAITVSNRSYGYLISILTSEGGCYIPTLDIHGVILVTVTSLNSACLASTIIDSIASYEHNKYYNAYKGV